MRKQCANSNWHAVFHLWFFKWCLTEVFLKIQNDVFILYFHIILLFFYYYYHCYIYILSLYFSLKNWRYRHKQIIIKKLLNISYQTTIFITHVFLWLKELFKILETLTWISNIFQNYVFQNLNNSQKVLSKLNLRIDLLTEFLHHTVSSHTWYFTKRFYLVVSFILVYFHLLHFTYSK